MASLNQWTHEFEQVLGVGDGQGSLVCCNPRSRKESDMTVTELNRAFCHKFWQNIKLWTGLSSAPQNKCPFYRSHNICHDGSQDVHSLTRLLSFFADNLIYIFQSILKAQCLILLYQKKKKNQIPRSLK